MISVTIFTLGLWSAYVVVAAGAIHLLVVLVREWREKTLW